uniref:Uncharacterized protein n=1 Tax=Arundo donax TaxID=35708 RepID=A0A0A8ZBS0_ARUDO
MNSNCHKRNKVLQQNKKKVLNCIHIVMN